MHKKAAKLIMEPPKAEIKEVDGSTTLFLHGHWTVYSLDEGRDILASLAEKKTARRIDVISLEKVSAIDTSGALLINGISKIFVSASQPELKNDNPDFKAILDISREAARQKNPRAVRPPLLIRQLNAIGEKVVSELNLVIDIMSFLGQVIVRAFQSLKNPKDINIVALINQIEQTGVQAAPLLTVLNFFIGMVIAYMVAAQLQVFGAQIFVVSLLEMGVLREMGVLSTALMVAGRSGSSFTAQIGAMVSNEEVRAMQSMGIDPILRLVIPRVLALSICMPFLVMLSDISALLGGMFVLSFTMDISPTVFINTLHQTITVGQLMVGVLKAPFFAVIIGCVSCFLGFKATGSAESIGLLTTRSVVEAIFLVMVLDSFFALALNLMGI